MPTWNDHHYARAQEFTRLLAEALASAKAPESAPALELTAAPFLRPTPAPLPAAPPAPTPAASAPATPAPAAGPSASSVFKKIPWKK